MFTHDPVKKANICKNVSLITFSIYSLLVSVTAKGKYMIDHLADIGSEELCIALL